MDQKPNNNSVDNKISQENHAVYTFKNSNTPRSPITYLVHTVKQKRVWIPLLAIVVIAIAASSLMPLLKKDEAPKYVSSYKEEKYDKVEDYRDIYGVPAAELPAEKDEKGQESSVVETDAIRSDQSGEAAEVGDNSPPLSSYDEFYSEIEENEDFNEGIDGVEGEGYFEGEGPEAVPKPTKNDNPSKPTSEAAEFSVTSWNANFNNPPRVVIDHVKSLNSDLFGLQEMGSNARSASIVGGITKCNSCSYAAYAPTGANGQANPIVWKRDQFKLLASGSFQVNSAIQVNDGGGRENLLDKASNWVKLQERTSGKIFYHSNNHLVPSVEKNGKPAYDREKRLSMFANHMDGIVNTVKRANEDRLPIFVTGDFNVNYRNDKELQAPIFPYARLKNVNVYANWHYLGEPADGTHGGGRRLIDSVHVTKSNAVMLLSQKIGNKAGSDHAPVTVRARLK